MDKPPRFRSPLLLALLSLLLSRIALCSHGDTELWITYEDPNGETLYLKDNRRPSLYTDDYGDCLGNSLVNVTRFDAAFYKDNMTVLFHLAGDTALQNESVVMYIGVYAYGETRFDLTFNPCKANIASLCPLNGSVPISANGVIPVSASDVSSIPSLALSIPDFEGQAILRIFANSTQSEIGCYSAVITNGHSFAQPKTVGSALRIFTLVAMIASFAPAVYGEAVPTIRLHYAHSLSAGVVFAVFQHIYFTGALSVNWPSVLVAWWHNFAWSGGMIHNRHMQRAIDQLIGNVIGNTSQVGAAPSNSGNNNVGGGYDITQIYRRIAPSDLPVSDHHPLTRNIVSETSNPDLDSSINSRGVPRFGPEQHHLVRHLQARDYLANRTDGYRWYGRPIGGGMPLPGNYSGFSGTLAEENIRMSNAFMTGFVWFLIMFGLLTGFVLCFKWTLEALSSSGLIKRDRLRFFRDHWIGYTTIVALRICYLSFFLMMFLTIFEFSFRSSAYVKVVAAVIFSGFAVGMSVAATLACYYKVASDKVGRSKPVELKDLLEDPSWVSSERSPGSRDKIHDNSDYITRFGWLAARFRRRRWWFFSVWLAYEFLRAIFYAGASGHPLVQVFGLIIIESLSFGYIIWARPFEGRRLNVLVVDCLGFSKVASVALSAAFDIHFNLPRVTTTIIGIVLIAIQGILTIITLIAIVVGAISSYMSVSRSCENFRPRKWHGLRERYFDHLDRVVNDLPPEPKSNRRPKSHSEEPGEQSTGFEVKSIRRVAKIEDEDEEFVPEMQTQTLQGPSISVDGRPHTPTNASDTIVGTQRSETATPTCRSRAGSMQSLSRTRRPIGARPSRPSWTAKDFTDLGLQTTSTTRCRSRSLERAAADDGPAMWLANTYSNIDRLSRS